VNDKNNKNNFLAGYSRNGSGEKHREKHRARELSKDERKSHRTHKNGSYHGMGSEEDFED
jgi:hypothetical protein